MPPENLCDILDAMNEIGGGACGGLGAALLMEHRGKRIRKTRGGGWRYA